MGDSFRVGLFFGVFIAMGGSALFAALELRRARAKASFDPARRRKLRWRLWLGGPVFLLGVGVTAWAFVSPPTNLAELRRGLFEGCHAGCVQSGQTEQLCAQGCQCYVDQLEARYTPREINDLIIAVSRDGDAAAEAKLLEAANQCQQAAP